MSKLNNLNELNIIERDKLIDKLSDAYNLYNDILKYVIEGIDNGLLIDEELFIIDTNLINRFNDIHKNKDSREIFYEINNGLLSLCLDEEKIVAMVPKKTVDLIKKVPDVSLALFINDGYLSKLFKLTDLLEDKDNNMEKIIKSYLELIHKSNLSSLKFNLIRKHAWKNGMFFSSAFNTISLFFEIIEQLNMKYLNLKDKGINLPEDCYLETEFEITDNETSLIEPINNDAVSVFYNKNKPCMYEYLKGITDCYNIKLKCSNIDKECYSRKTLTCNILVSDLKREAEKLSLENRLRKVLLK